VLDQQKRRDGFLEELGGDSACAGYVNYIFILYLNKSCLFTLRLPPGLTRCRLFP